MQTPEALASAFGKDFQDWISQFAAEQNLIPDASSLESSRFLSRSVIPHINKLSDLFNRKEYDHEKGLDPYWKQSSNPAHLRLAYFLYFMPSNLYRVASVWAELSRLGFQWQAGELNAVEFGAGPASGACGIAAGEKYASLGLPQAANWALIEQDRTILDLGTRWAETYFSHLNFNQWGIRSFHRKLDIQQGGLLPPSAPKFNLFLMSFYLNELHISPQKLASILIQSWSKHLADEGIVILIEPALRLQSRRLLELRRELLKEQERTKKDDWKILLPCLGHQSCGALADAEDWCHEEVKWWRPPYFRLLDQMAHLDRKTLPFSYLVIIKSQRPRNVILPKLASKSGESQYRIVSPAHSEGRDYEFFICGQEGKRRARYRPNEAINEMNTGEIIQRGDILLETEIRGDPYCSRIERYRKPM